MHYFVIFCILRISFASLFFKSSICLDDYEYPIGIPSQLQVFSMYHSTFLESFEDTTGLIRICKSKKNVNKNKG